MKKEAGNNGPFKKVGAIKKVWILSIFDIIIESLYLVVSATLSPLECSQFLKNISEEASRHLSKLIQLKFVFVNH